MSKIIHTKDTKLYLGDLFNANDEETLTKHGVKTIICVAKDVQIRLDESKFTIHKYDLEDTHECDISVYFDEICDLIHKEKDGVIVNCLAGISRSASFTIAYLMKYYNMVLADAFQYVKKRRNQICPNKRFMECLLEYEIKLFDENSLTYDECIQLFYYT
jgi:protein-tyrosine phosphatase